MDTGLQRDEAGLTQLLIAWRGGNRQAFERLLERAYGDLKRIAVQRLQRFSGPVTLSATELLHEAVLGLVEGEMDFRDSAHFFATMSMAVRSILVDHARARAADKRGGDCVRLSLSRVDAGEEAMALELLALEQALTTLDAVDPRSARVMHLSCFGDLKQEQIAEVLKISVVTVKRDLRFARAWIAKAMGHDD
jgi:RNA polymerase sigma factor (TIGR02999 family)